MAINLNMGLRKKLLAGFIGCAIITALAVFVGVRSLNQTNQTMNKTSENINNSIQEESSQSKLQNEIRSLLNSVTNAKNEKELSKASAMLANLKSNIPESANTELQIKIINQIEKLSALRNQQLNAKDTNRQSEKNLLTLQKNSDKIRAQLLGIASSAKDDVEFSAVLSIEDAVEAVTASLKAGEKKNGESAEVTAVKIDTKKTLKSVNSMSTASQEALTHIKSTGDFESLTQQISLLLVKILLADDEGTVNYTYSELDTLVGNTKETLSAMPESDGIKDAEKILTKLADEIRGVGRAKIKIISARESILKIESEIHKILVPADKSAQGNKTTAGNKEALKKQTKSLPELMEQLDKARLVGMNSMAADTEEAGKDNQQTVSSQKTILKIVGVFAVVLAIVIGLVISRSIIRPIMKVVDFAEKLNKGDLSVRLDMGKPLNCSDIKSCGVKSCPSYGKEAYCWIESGSFSNTPTCPSAKAGKDCRDCEVWKSAKSDEFDEMGSALNAVVEELAIRAKLATRIAEGDLTEDVNLASDADTLGKAFQNMLDSLRQIVTSIHLAAEQVNSGAQQINGASQALSQGATQSAASLEEITSSVTQIGSQSSHNAENAHTANTLASSARDSASKGTESMQAMTNAMTDINSSSQEISKIIKVIDDIAFQTNLLALNAAVEAARAGRHGKGFAVVAEEVRSLAGRSAKAAKETADLIASSGSKVENGTKIAEQTSSALNEIVEGITKAADLVGDIAAASNEQAQGVSEVSSGLQQIDSVTQQNTANAEETAAATHELINQARNLQQLISKFKLSGLSEDAELIVSEAEAVSTPDVRANFNTPPSLPEPEAASWGGAPAIALESEKRSDELMPWSDSFKVGVDKFDGQHKRLVSMINTLYAAMQQGKANNILGEILDELIEYTANHFQEEETMMNLYKYPKYEEHLKEHQSLVAQVVDAKEKFEQGSPLGVQTMNFLKQWLINHILETDMNYGDFFREKNIS
ncbi:MAG: bacteriohemerythrin [Planctomycetota bacterium]|jgi:hemerythrin-like metal-binding protein